MGNTRLVTVVAIPAHAGATAAFFQSFVVGRRGPFRSPPHAAGLPFIALPYAASRRGMPAHVRKARSRESALRATIFVPPHVTVVLLILMQQRLLAQKPQKHSYIDACFIIDMRPRAANNLEKRP